MSKPLHDSFWERHVPEHEISDEGLGWTCLTDGNRCIVVVHNTLCGRRHQSLVAGKIRSLRNTIAFLDRIYTPPNDLRQLRQLCCTKTHPDLKAVHL